MKFPYSVLTGSQSFAESMPRIPISLASDSNRIDVVALVDSGAMVNVLPFQTGLALGFVWDDSRANLHLGGMLNQHPAMTVTALAFIADFTPSTLSFAWTNASLSTVILGQVNFFMEHEVIFRRWLREFEVNPRPR